MINVRLSQDLEKRVTEVAEELGLTKSELVRRCLEEYVEKNHSPSAWELGKDLFGKYGSGKGNLSSDRKELIREKIRKKHR